VKSIIEDYGEILKEYDLTSQELEILKQERYTLFRENLIKDKIIEDMKKKEEEKKKREIQREIEFQKSVDCLNLLADFEMQVRIKERECFIYCFFR